MCNLKGLPEGEDETETAGAEKNLGLSMGERRLAAEAVVGILSDKAE